MNCISRILDQSDLEVLLGGDHGEREKAIERIFNAMDGNHATLFGGYFADCRGSFGDASVASVHLINHRAASMWVRYRGSYYEGCAGRDGLVDHEEEPVAVSIDPTACKIRFSTIPPPEPRDTRDEF